GFLLRQGGHRLLAPGPELASDCQTEQTANGDGHSGHRGGWQGARQPTAQGQGGRGNGSSPAGRKLPEQNDPRQVRQQRVGETRDGAAPIRLGIQGAADHGEELRREGVPSNPTASVRDPLSRPANWRDNDSP